MATQQMGPPKPLRRLRAQQGVGAAPQMVVPRTPAPRRHRTRLRGVWQPGGRPAPPRLRAPRPRAIMAAKLGVDLVQVETSTLFDANRDMSRQTPADHAAFAGEAFIACMDGRSRPPRTDRRGHAVYACRRRPPSLGLTPCCPASMTIWLGRLVGATNNRIRGPLTQPSSHRDPHRSRYDGEGSPARAWNP